MKYAGQIILFRFPQTDLVHGNCALPCFLVDSQAYMTTG